MVRNRGATPSQVFDATRRERRAGDRRKTTVALAPGQVDRRQGPRREADRGLGGETQFGRRHLERLEFEARERARRLSERREELLGKLDSEGRRLLEIERLLVNSALQPRHVQAEAASRTEKP